MHKKLIISLTLMVILSGCSYSIPGIGMNKVDKELADSTKTDEVQDSNKDKESKEKQEKDSPKETKPNNENSTQPNQQERTSAPEVKQPSKPVTPNPSKTTTHPKTTQNQAKVNFLILVNKTHSLSAGFVPSNLVVPNVPFPFTGDYEKKYLQKESAASLEKMFAKAKQENIYLYGLSGYRSYKTQEAIFAYNVNRFGSESEANKISAKPGQSEHQTGLTMDVTSKGVNFQLVQAFENTAEGKWVKENAHKFGFIIRYPKGKDDITGYTYEPWHLRYVQVGPATEIYDSGLTLEQYLAR